MKSTFVIVAAMVATSVLPAQTGAPAKKKAAAPAQKAAVSTIKPVVIPSDAKANPDGTYSYTDKQGKHWTFSRTPFGISRTEDLAASGGASFAQATTDQFISATETPGGYKFTRKTPFGPTSWERKTDELSDEERRVVERTIEKTKPASNPQ